MNILLIGITIGLIGKVLLGLSVILVHSKIAHEHRIDTVVLREMRRERNIAILAITLMIVGYAMEMVFFAGA